MLVTFFFLKKAVKAIQPDTLMVELCSQRAGLLFPPEKTETEGSEGWAGALEVLKRRQGLSGVFQLLLTQMYKKIAGDLNVRPGAEFQAALEAVRKEGRPCRLVLGDREVSLTIQRAWALLPLWEKLRVCFHLSLLPFYSIKKEDVEKMKENDVLSALVKEFCETFPSLSRVLLFERDVYLAKSLFQSPGKRVLAVVGLGHAKGMKEAIEKWKEGKDDPNEACKEFKYVPPTRWTFRRLMLLFAVVIFVVLAASIYGLKKAVWYLF